MNRGPISALPVLKESLCDEGPTDNRRGFHPPGQRDGKESPAQLDWLHKHVPLPEPRWVVQSILPLYYMKACFRMESFVEPSKLSIEMLWLEYPGVDLILFAIL